MLTSDYVQVLPTILHWAEAGAQPLFTDQPEPLTIFIGHLAAMVSSK